MPARNTIEIILTATDQASRTLSNVGTSMQAMGQRLGVAGALIENGMAPVRRGLESAIEAAMGFETSMVNAGSILGKTKDEMSGLSAEVLALGTNSIFGGQQAADAYYDIVSGVQDVSTHMAILQGAMDLATAGGASLKTATNAVINVMNAYNLPANKAVYVTDALTKAVGMGKGTMDEFAAALPAATAIASQLGIDFHEVATQAAFLTTKGFTASEAVTSITANMIALTKPNADMTKALQELGVESGQAAIDMWGLHGTLQRVGQTSVAEEKGMAALVGSVEALKGAGYLAGEEFLGFRDKFITSMDGATAAAKRIQMESLTMKWQLFQSKVEGLAIKIGSVFLPVLTDLADKITPVLDLVSAWVDDNQELVQGIVLIVGAMVIAGPIIAGLGSVISTLGMVLGAVTTPIGAVILAVKLLAMAWAADFGGIRSFVTDVVWPAIQPFFDWLGSVWTDTIEPGLRALHEWFTVTALPAVIAFVRDTVQPAISDFFDFLGGVWLVVQPALNSLHEWFTVTALPAIREAVDRVKESVDWWIQVLQGAWDVISPTLANIFGWFVETGLPAVVGFITDTVIPGVQRMVDIIVGIWEAISPHIIALRDGILGALQPIIDVIDRVVGGIDALRGGHGAAVSTIVEATAGMSDPELWERAVAAAQAQNLGILTMPAAHVAFDQLKAARDAQFGRASGGPVSSGQPYLVGEHGPELMVPGRSGFVVPNGALGGGNINVYVTAPEGSGRNAALGFGRAIALELRRRGA